MLIFLLPLILLIPNITWAGSDFPNGWCTDTKIRNGRGFCHLGKNELNGGDFPNITSDCVDFDTYEQYFQQECAASPRPAGCSFALCATWDDPNQVCDAAPVLGDPNYEDPYAYGQRLVGQDLTLVFEDSSETNSCNSNSTLVWETLDVSSAPNSPITLSASATHGDIFYSTENERPSCSSCTFSAQSRANIANLTSAPIDSGAIFCDEVRGTGSLMTQLPDNTFFVQYQVHDKNPDSFPGQRSPSILRFNFFNAAGSLLSFDTETIETASRHGQAGMELHQWVSGEAIKFAQWEILPTDTDNDGKLNGAAWQAGICSGNDIDGDTILDGTDICPFISDVAQTDTDMDGVGDACQCGDANADGVLNTTDIAKMRTWVTIGCGSVDLDSAQGTWPQACQDMVGAAFDPTKGNTNNQTIRNLNLTDVARARDHISGHARNIQWCAQATLIQNPAAFNQVN